jgi:hypothetical protein
MHKDMDTNSKYKMIVYCLAGNSCSAVFGTVPPGRETMSPRIITACNEAKKIVEVEKRIKKTIAEKTAMDAGFLSKLRDLLEIDENKIGEDTWRIFQDTVTDRYENTRKFREINREICDAIGEGKLEELETIIDREIGAKWREATATGNRKIIEQAKTEHNLVNLEKACHSAKAKFSWLELAIQSKNLPIVALFCLHDALLPYGGGDEESTLAAKEKLIRMAFHYGASETQTFLETYFSPDADEKFFKIVKEMNMGPAYLEIPGERNPRQKNVNFVQKIADYFTRGNSDSMYI